MVEKKVYNSWAFTENQSEKGKVNSQIYKELTERYRILQVGREEYSEEDYDLIYRRTPEYKHSVYTVLKNETLLSHDALLLIFDHGNLCFGGSYLGRSRFRVDED